MSSIVTGTVVRACAVLAVLLLAACSSAPPATFDISAAPMPKSGAGRGLLVIAEPNSVALLDSDRLVVRTADNGVSYLTGAQWSDRLPKLLQARLIQSFENARRTGSVGRPGDRLVAAYQLNSEIRTFEVQEATGEAVVEITVKIVNDRNGQILAAEMFAARAPVGAIGGANAARVLNETAQAVMAQIVAWASGRA